MNIDGGCFIVGAWLNVWPGMGTQVQGRSTPRRASYMPGRAPLCPTRTPPQPQTPIIIVFHRGGQRCGCRTAPNRDLTATQRGHLHHEGRDTPATRQREAPHAAKPPPLPLVSGSLTGAVPLGGVPINAGRASLTGTG
ncbi:hypothetical protein HMPREF0970_00310 [Schaalia odontolytica F0309]|uniref:Uncharacterized protein n=1 Tax=Schaalia odontolytica F0309 TaxID=649742 RepID=D4TWK0_9ACTO|nr:hypothetical protein HMPREF0970_00310 [Schaalia odontolytica F0309]